MHCTPAVSLTARISRFTKRQVDDRESFHLYPQMYCFTVVRQFIRIIYTETCIIMKREPWLVDLHNCFRLPTFDLLSYKF